MEIQDLASQAVGLACDPDPGERWWDACAGAGGKALHLSALMQGKGLVVATDINESKLKETVRRARRSPFRNVTTKVWDGKHVAGKPGSFDGVLVDAPCSALGTWRRNPDARWTLDREAIGRLAEIAGPVAPRRGGGREEGRDARLLRLHPHPDRDDRRGPPVPRRAPRIQARPVPAPAHRRRRPTARPCSGRRRRTTTRCSLRG